MANNPSVRGANVFDKAPDTRNVESTTFGPLSCFVGRPFLQEDLATPSLPNLLLLLLLFTRQLSLLPPSHTLTAACKHHDDTTMN